MSFEKTRPESLCFANIEIEYEDGKKLTIEPSNVEYAYIKSSERDTKGWLRFCDAGGWAFGSGKIVRGSVWFSDAWGKTAGRKFFFYPDERGLVRVVEGGSLQKCSIGLELEGSPDPQESIFVLDEENVHYLETWRASFEGEEILRHELKSSCYCICAARDNVLLSMDGCESELIVRECSLIYRKGFAFEVTLVLG